MGLTGFTAQRLSFLFFAAFVAGVLDTLAGGGGLIALPALMMSGISPLLRLQGTMGTATATYLMRRNKKVRWNDVKFLMLSAFIGAVFCTISVQFVNTELLTFVIPAVLLLTAVYFLLSPLPK